MSSLYNCIWINFFCFVFFFIAITFFRVEEYISQGKNSLLVDPEPNLLCRKLNLPNRKPVVLKRTCEILNLHSIVQFFSQEFSCRSLLCSLGFAISASVCSSWCFKNSDGSSDPWISSIISIGEALLDSGGDSLKETLRPLSSSLFGLEIRPNVVFYKVL